MALPFIMALAVIVVVDVQMYTKEAVEEVAEEAAVAVVEVAVVDKCSSNDNTTYEAINPENSPD